MCRNAEQVEMRKSWVELGQKQKKRRSEHLFRVLNNTAEQNEVEPVQMIGSLLQRAAYQNDKKVAEVGSLLEVQEPVQHKHLLSLDHATWVAMKGAGMGKLQWR